MSGLEDLVRDALVAHEPQSSDGTRLLLDVRAREARQRRRRGWSAAVMVAAATAAVITVVTIQAQPHNARAPSAATNAPVHGTPDQSPSSEPTGDSQIVSFHGVEVTVPASWMINDAKCGTPIADTVQIWQGMTEACAIPRPPGLTVVQMWAYRAGDDPRTVQATVAAVATDATTVGGQPALRGRGIPAGMGNEQLSVLVLPGVGVVISVESPDPARAQALLDAVQLAPIDHNGCRDEVDMLTTPVSARSGAASALVPDAPTGASICRYSDDWLGSSVAVAPADLDGLVAMLNALPVGESTPGPDFFEPDQLCAEDHHRGFIIQFAYAETPPVDVYVRISGCPVLTASNGARTTEVDKELVEFLTTRVGYDGSWPDVH